MSNVYKDILVKDLPDISGEELVSIAIYMNDLYSNHSSEQYWYKFNQCQYCSLNNYNEPTIAIFSQNSLVCFICDKHSASMSTYAEYKKVYLDKLNKVMKHILL